MTEEKSVISSLSPRPISDGWVTGIAQAHQAHRWGQFGFNLNSFHKRNKSSEIKKLFSIQALHFNSLPELNWIEPNPVQEDHTNPGLDSSLLLPPFPKLISDPCRQDRYGNRTQGFLQSTWVSPPYCFHLSSPLCSVIPRKDEVEYSSMAQT